MSPLFHISQAGEKNPLPQSPWIVAWIPSSQKISMKSPYQIIIGEAPERHVCWLKKSHEYCIPVKNTPSVNQVLCVNKNPIGSPRFLVSLFFMGFPMLYGFPGEPRVASAAQSHPQQHRGRALPRLPRFRVDAWARAESGEIWRGLGDIIPQIWWVHPKMWWFMGLFSWIYGNHPPNFKNSEVIPKNGDIYGFFSMDSHSSSVWWSTKIWWIVPKKCSLQQCMVSISVSGTDHGSHSKPEQDVRNLEPLLLLGCKARLMYVALFDTLNIPFESGNND